MVIIINERNVQYKENVVVIFEVQFLLVFFCLQSAGKVNYHLDIVSNRTIIGLIFSGFMLSFLDSIAANIDSDWILEDVSSEFLLY